MLMDLRTDGSLRRVIVEIQRGNTKTTLGFVDPLPVTTPGPIGFRLVYTYSEVSGDISSAPNDELIRTWMGDDREEAARTPRVNRTVFELGKSGAWSRRIVYALPTATALGKSSPGSE